MVFAFIYKGSLLVGHLQGVTFFDCRSIKKFVEQRDHYIAQGRPFLSLDETSFGRSGNVIKGYSVVGERLYFTKKQPRMTTESVLAIASVKGMVNRVATKGSVNQHLLVSFLKSSSIPRSSVVLLDNAAIHKTKLVKETAQQLGIDLLYVPPWFNPIEGIFSIVKRAFYKDLSIDESFGKVTTSHCNSFFNKSLLLKDRPKN